MKNEIHTKPPNSQALKKGATFNYTGGKCFEIKGGGQRNGCNDINAEPLLP